MAVTRFKKRKPCCFGLVKAFCLAVLIFTEAAGATTECARFVFPTLPANQIISPQENSIVELPFKLNTDRCLGSANTPHFIYVSGPKSGQDYCVLRLSTNTCVGVVNENNCPCAETGGAAVFTKTVTKTDSGWWTWRTGDGISQTALVFLNVQSSNSTDTDTRTDRSVSADLNKLSAKPFLNDAGITTSSYSSDDVTTSTLTETQKEVAGRDNKAEREKTETTKNGGREDKEEEGKPKSKESASASSDDKDTNDRKEDDVDDDDNDDTSVPESLITGVVFVGANIVTIIAVTIIVITIRKRRKRKRERAANATERRRPNATLPRRPQSNAAYDVTTPRRNDVRTLSRSSHNYQSLPSRQTSGIYDEIPAEKERASDGYLTPVCKEVKSSNAYDDAV